MSESKVRGRVDEEGLVEQAGQVGTADKVDKGGQ
jgi:hypothetical protein